MRYRTHSKKAEANSGGARPEDNGNFETGLYDLITATEPTPEAFAQLLDAAEAGKLFENEELREKFPEVPDSAFEALSALDPEEAVEFRDTVGPTLGGQGEALEGSQDFLMDFAERHIQKKKKPAAKPKPKQSFSESVLMEP
jgi:hypothetical protein